MAGLPDLPDTPSPCQPKPPKGTTAVRGCRVCGGPSGSRRGFSPSGFCSRKCWNVKRLEAAKTRRPRICAVCLVPFIGRFIYRSKTWPECCSDKCRRVVLNRRPAMLLVACAQCGVGFRRTAAAVKRSKVTFCNKSCQWVFMRGERSAAYRGDKDPNRGAEWNRLAETIRTRDGHRCRRCECTQGENGQKLSVDHVRPWRSFTDKSLANHPDNLVALCRKCHSFKTMTVESAWLRGDVLAWKKWVGSLQLPSAKFGWVA